MKMLSFSVGVTRLDRKRNELFRGTANIRCFRERGELDGLDTSAGEREGRSDDEVEATR